MNRIAASPAELPGDERLRFLPADWRLDRDVCCPVCRYNLRGLREPRCPECGQSFRWQELLHAACARCGESLSGVDAEDCPACRLPLDWPALLDSACVIQPRLYEYSNRPFRAALRSLLVIWIPPLFWRYFVLEMPPQIQRLRAYRRWVYRVGLLGLGMLAGIRAFQVWNNLSPIPERALILLGFALGMPKMISVALPRFTPTLARFRVRSEQLERCLTYLASPLAWLGFVACVAIAWNLADVASWWLRWPPPRLPYWRYIGFEPLEELPTLLDHSPTWRRQGGYGPATLVTASFAAALIWTFVFEYVALCSYLRLRRRDALALTLSTYAISLLALACAYILLALLMLVVFFV